MGVCFSATLCHCLYLASVSMATGLVVLHTQLRAAELQLLCSLLLRHPSQRSVRLKQTRGQERVDSKTCYLITNEQEKVFIFVQVEVKQLQTTFPLLSSSFSPDDCFDSHLISCFSVVPYRQEALCHFTLFTLVAAS